MEKEICEELGTLIEKAKCENLWFYNSYYNMWVSPTELAKKNKEGKLIWGANNWILRNPQEKVSELKREIEAIEDELIQFQMRMLQ
jgi:Zn-finger protein